MKRTPNHSVVDFEPLEDRFLLAAQPTYDFARLSCYASAGRWWNYDTTYSLTSNIMSSQSGSASSKVSVARYNSKTPAIFKIATSGSAGKPVSMLLQRDSRGMSLAEMDTGFGALALKLKATGTQIAPATMVMGKLYQGAGTFAGSFSMSVAGSTAAGTVSGISAATCKIVSTETVKTPAGAFKATKGVYTISLSGTITISFQGQTEQATFTEKLQTTFWAVNNVGIVRSDSTLNTAVSAEGETANVKMHTVSVLTNYGPK